MHTFKARLLSVLVLASLLATLPGSYVRAFGIIYRVTPNSGVFTRRCGASWTSACSLQAALNMATLGDVLWVAAGTYMPTSGADRTVSFILKNGVVLYGGFAGNETALEQRDPNVNITILSGNIGDPLSRYDNSYHVVVTSGMTETTILDGFTITDGQSDGTSPYDKGAGLLNLNGSPMLRNLTVSDNNTGNAYGDGAGMYSTGDPTLRNVIFTGNRTGSYGHGGGMYSNGEPLIMDITFTNNWACVGGGLYSEGRPIVTNVTFSGNQAANGAGMYNHGDTDFTNTTFSGNTAMYSGGGLETGSAWDLTNPTFTNVTFNGNHVTNATSGKGGAISSYNGNIVIHNSILWGNTAAIEPEINQAGNHSINIIYSVVEGGCPAGGICAQIYTSDPRLGELGNYGGFTQTIPLLRGSQAIDRALDASCPFDDQRGVARPQGKRCDIGAYEVLAPIGPGIYDDTHPAWLYSGTWTLSQGTGTYNNTLHHTKTEGSYADVIFNGVQIQLMYMTGPDRGAIDVYIDGKYADTIDANTLLPSQATWTSRAWDPGEHIVRFQAAGRGRIDMDGIQVLDRDVLPPGDVTGFTATAGTVTGSVNLSWIAPADDAGNNASGPVTSYLVKYSTAPFTSWSDGTLITTGLPTPAAPGNPQTMSVEGLNPGTLYYFAIRAQDEQANLSLNYGTANAAAKSPAVGPGIYDDADPAWSYTGSWVTYSGSGPYNNTLHYTNMVGDSAQVLFHGTQFTLTYAKANNRGAIGVYVDNVQVGTINAYSSSTQWQQTWTSPSFTAGDHTVRFVYASGGTYIDVDAITILP